MPLNRPSTIRAAPIETTFTIFLARPTKFYTKSYWALFIAIKILFVAISLALGACHHFTSKRATSAEDFNFKRSLRIEMATFAAILIATVTLVSFTPPKILSQERSTSTAPGSSLSQSSYSIPITFDNGMKGVISIPKLTLGTPSPISIDLNGPKVQSAKNMYIYFSDAALNLTDIQVTLTGSKNHYTS